MGAETFAGLFAEDPGKNTFGGPNANLAALWESFWPKGDPLLLWAADHGGGGDFSRGIAPWWFLWRRDAAPSGDRPPLDPAVLFRDAGHAVLQSPRLWVALQGGWIPDSSIHKNFDLGSFVLVADGARRVPDPGYGKKGAELHSVLVLPGKDGTPREQVAGARGRYLALDAGDRWRYAAVDLSAAYGDAVPRWVRHVLLLGDDTAVILDQVALAQAGPAELRVQLASEARLEGQRALVAGDPPLSVDVLGATPELVATPRALALRLDPSRAEHLAVTVLRVGAPGPTPTLRQGKKGLTLSTAAGKLELVQRGGAYVPAKLGREKLSPGDPAARSLERPGGKRRRR
ncbi:MAG: heparinase II/III family protein [Planctomycetota bacterium]